MRAGLYADFPNPTQRVHTIGTSPAPWHASYFSGVLQVGVNAFATGAGVGESYVSNNLYYELRGWVYQSAMAGSLFSQVLGRFEWYTAPTGVAKAVATTTLRMTLDANGNLGIGVTPSGGLLHVHSTSLDSQVYVSSGAPRIALGDNAVYASATNRVRIAMPTAANNFLAGTAAGDLLVFTEHVTGSGYASPEGNIIFATASGNSSAITERMRISGAGNVGIGGTPSGIFHVYAAQPTMYFSDTTAGAANNTTSFIFHQKDTNATLREAAAIKAISIAPGASAVGSDLAFFTANNAADAEQLRLTSDGRLYGKSLHNNAGAITGTTNQYIASGTEATYTAAPVAVGNCSALTVNKALYTRLGNIVDVAVSVNLTVTTGAVQTTFNVTVPVASAFALGENAMGVVMDINNLVAGQVVAPGAANTAQGTWIPTTNGVHTVRLHFRYVVT